MDGFNSNETTIRKGNIQVSDSLLHFSRDTFDFFFKS